MPHKQPRAHIEELQVNNSEQSRAAVRSANLLARDIATAFQGGHKFIFELLQNADDATEGYDLYLMSNFPEKGHLVGYKNSYLLIEGQQLFYVSSDERCDRVTVYDYPKLREALATIHKDVDDNKIHLSSKQVHDLITLNGGHIPEEKHCRVTFELIQDPITGQCYLSFRHNGKHFSEQDVEKICDYASQQFGDKAASPDKIGYKDIGFKAVFSVANCAYIFSGGYQFRFEEPQLQPQAPATQWPIIPIWTELTDLPHQLQAAINPEEVSFIFRIRPHVNLQEELNYLIQNSYVMIFLRRVSSLRVVRPGYSTQIEMRAAHPFRYFSQDGQPATSWLLKEVSINVPETIKDQLRHLNEQACPQRLREAEQVKITFAAYLSSDARSIRNDTSFPLYCYLPTQVNMGFTYVVNADFLLNPERTALVENGWNAFLLSLIGEFQFEWFADVASHDLYKSQVLKLFNWPQSHGAMSLYQSYQNGFRAGSDRVAFIPGQHLEDGLLQLNNAVFDQTGFYRGLPRWNFVAGRRLIAYGLENSAGIEQHLKAQPDQYIDDNKLREYLPGYVMTWRTVDFQKHVLNYLRLRASQPYDYFVNSVLPANLILSSSNALVSVQQVFINRGVLPEPLSNLPGLMFVHPELSEFYPFLMQISVREATRANFVYQYLPWLISQNIPLLINNGRIQLIHLFEITRLIFDAYQHKEFDDTVFDKIKGLPVVTTNNTFRNGPGCFLSDDYEPRMHLQQIIVGLDIFINGSYMREGDDSALWTHFWIKLGVKDHIKFTKLPSVTRAQALNDVPIMSEYLAYLQNQGVPKQKQAENLLAKHHIQNLFWVDLIEHMANPQLARFLWAVIIQNWGKIKSTKMRYTLSSSGHDLTVTFLQFVINRQLNTSLLFMPSLLPIIEGVEGFQHANFPDNLTLSREQAEYFGFRVELTLEECIRVLNYINRSAEAKNPRRYAALFKHILNLNLHRPEESLQNWHGKLLSRANNLRDRFSLRYVHGDIEMPISPDLLKELPGLSKDEMRDLCEIFGIPVENQEAFSVVPKGTHPDLAEVTKQAILARLSLIALLEANLQIISSVELLHKFFVLLNNMEWVSTERITLRGVSGTELLGKRAYFCEREKRLYFVGDYRNKYTQPDLWHELGKILQLDRTIIGELPKFIELDDDAIEEYLQNKSINPTDLPKLGNITDYVPDIMPKASNSEVDTLAQMFGQMLNTDASTVNLQSQVLGPSTTTTTTTTTAGPLQPLLLAVPAGLPTQQFVSPTKSGGANLQDPTVGNALPVVPNKPFDESNYKVVKQSKVNLTMKPAFDPAQTGLDHTTYDKPDSELPPVERKRIGREGEKIVYGHLFHHYQAKNTGAEITKTQTGFVHSYTSPKKGTQVNVEVKWYNLNLEEGKDKGRNHDIMVIKNGEECYIEVKATVSSDSTAISLSGNEWRLMQWAGPRYSIYRVFNVSGEQEPFINKIKDPAQAAANNQFHIDGVKFRY